MIIKRKYQVFVSSTYTDLIAERQAAVGAILRAGHIPAGMELFTAGDLSQMDTIRKWITKSDVFLLILGGRYGSLEPATKLSYVELEYDFAIDNHIPSFALVLSDKYIDCKVKTDGRDVLEKKNQHNLERFREKVLSRMSLFCDDLKDIEINIHRSLTVLADEHDLTGWIRAEDVLGLGNIEEVEQQRREFLQRSIQESSRRMAAERQLEAIRAALPNHLLELLQKIVDDLARSGKDLSSEATKQQAFARLVNDLLPPVIDPVKEPKGP